MVAGPGTSLSEGCEGEEGLGTHCGGGEGAEEDEAEEEEEDEGGRGVKGVEKEEEDW